MTNAEAVRNLCNAVINTFYPDAGAVAVALSACGLEPGGESAARDPDVFRASASLCLGYVEGSRSENGVATSVRSEEAVKRALRHWCRLFGLDEDEELDGSLVIVRNLTNRW